MKQISNLIVGCIRAYQVAMSPYLQSSCRFQPSCSEYAIQAVDRHGVICGGKLSFGRIFRCVPGQRSGFDPVP